MSSQITILRNLPEMHHHFGTQCIFCNNATYKNNNLEWLQEYFVDEDNIKVLGGTKFENLYPWQRNFLKKNFPKYLLDSTAKIGQQYTQEKILTGLFMKYGISAKRNVFICNQCFEKDQHEYLDIEHTGLKSLKNSDVTMKFFNIQLNNVAKNPYGNISPLSKEKKKKKKKKKKLIVSNCLNFDLLSNWQCITFCRLDKLTITELAQRGVVEVDKLVVWLFFFAHAATLQVIGAIFNYSKGTLSNWVNDTTDKLFINYASPHFKFKPVCRKWIRENTTVCSKIILNITDPKACIVVIDGKQFRVNDFS